MLPGVGLRKGRVTRHFLEFTGCVFERPLGDTDLFLARNPDGLSRSDPVEGFKTINPRRLLVE
jgi:hypothetical protein